LRLAHLLYDHAAVVAYTREELADRLDGLGVHFYR
jgi:hypothetical protein